jgi:dolichol-phosphate mannosyltransferase
VIPCHNESGNIAKLLSLLSKEYYPIVVDDGSGDGTGVIAQKAGAKVLFNQHQGLGQTIIDGINASDGDVVVVMDGDLSHNPEAVPELLKPILEQGYDFVIGSRYVEGGDYSNWALNRKIKSLIGVKLMQLVTGVRDSNSGFFAFRKTILDGVDLKPSSWKIMLEILFKGHWVSKKETPIIFRDREYGESDNNIKEKVKHAYHMLKLLVWKFRRYIKFACVGGIGALWYFSTLYFLTERVGVWYGLSAVIGTLIAITNNYLINHYYTFKKERSRNKRLFRGWLKYIGNSALGDGADWCVLILFTEVFGMWYMLSAFIASGIASVMKYTIAKNYIWGGGRRTAKDADYEWHAFYQGLPWQKRWKRILASIVKEFAERSSGNAGSVLDVGCGSSPQGLLIKHNDYIGMDINNSKIKYMQSKKLKDTLFVHGGFDNITFLEKGYFDTVLFVEVIEHLSGVHEAERNLLKINEMLKVGGKLIVATPNYGGIMGRMMDRLYGVFQKNAYADDHRLKFDLDSLIVLCRRCGLEYEDSKIPSGADMVCLFKKV